jgi:hypothetical protein
MSSRINNYDDLIRERKTLEVDLARYRSEIDTEVQLIRQKVDKVTNVFNFFNRPQDSTQNNKLLEAGTNLGIELFVRQRLLAKSGWFTKLTLPFLLKKISSKAISLVQAVRR